MYLLLYKLKCTQSHQSKCELIRVKTISAVLFWKFKHLKYARKWQDSHFLFLCRAIPRIKCWSHFYVTSQVFRPLPHITLTLIQSRKITCCNAIVSSRRSISFKLCTAVQTPMQYHFPWNPHSLVVLIPFLIRESKTCSGHPLSYVLFLVRGRHLGASRISV